MAAKVASNAVRDSDGVEQEEMGNAVRLAKEDQLKGPQAETTENFDTSLPTATQFSLQLNDIVHEFKKLWEKIWTRFKGTVGAPWRN